jgi:sialate O-acetylesterase
MRRIKLNFNILIFIATIGILSSSRVMAQDNWERVINLEGKWKFAIGDKPIWSETYFNDLNWEEIYVPSKWEDEGFNGYDGYAWYRRTFDGAQLKNKELAFNLILGYIDDVDEVYFNGKRIGSSGSFPPRYHTAYNALRNYFIPNELINFSGKNVIAVRVFDAEIEGGIVSGDAGIYSNKADVGLTINLRGNWDFKTTKANYERATDFDEKIITALSASENSDGWTNITVPSIWENQGFHDYDGAAWYRKKFIIPKEMASEDLVLLLGKIDDTDRTFLNGKQIGTTNYRHDKQRIYYVQAGQFKAGQANTLIVYVDDPHGDGGIYEGPVGIMKQTDFTKYIRWK